MRSNNYLIGIVDDDKAIGRALGRLVKLSGYDVRVMTSSQECLTLVQTEHLDCLVLDVVMPGMNGMELLNSLRALGKEIPTVFITAYDRADYKNEALSLGCIAVLQKPFKADLLLSSIAKALLDEI